MKLPEPEKRKKKPRTNQKATIVAIHDILDFLVEDKIN
jgi:hypothetical protein